MTEIFRPPFFQPDSINGVPLAGALLYFYVAGTTTPITVYQDSGLITPHASPVVADASGIFPAIYVNTTTYKIVLQTSAGVTVKTYDNINTTSSSNTVLDGTFVIQNTSDQTKQAVFNAGNISTATTRTYSFPDATGTIALTSNITNVSTSSNDPFINFSIGTPTVSGNALTIPFKGVDGNDHSATNVGYVNFRSATAGSGAVSQLTITSAQSIVIPSTATMGFTSAVIGKIWIGAFNDAGTLRFAVVNVLSGTSIMALSDGIYSATATPASSAQVIYSNAAVTSKAFTVLGYLEATEATAGTWATAPSLVQVRTPSTPLPGTPIQIARTDTGAVSTGTTIVPYDDTIPQITEGDQYMTQAIVPRSAANLLRVTAQGIFANTVSNNQMLMSLFQDATASALATSNVNYPTNGVDAANFISKSFLAGTTSSSTLRIRMGASNASTTTFNGAGGSRLFGGALNSFLQVEEVVA